MKHLTMDGAILLLFLCGGGSRVEAQGVASSFDQLGVLVKPGDSITVVEVGGSEIKGRVARLSRDRLTLQTAAGTRELGEPEVTLIRHRRGDSLKNGAIIGAIAGIAYFVTGAALLGDTDGGDVIVGTAIAGGLLSAGMGAAAGAGIDALITHQQVIYRRAVAGSRVGVSPLFGPGRNGVAITVTF